jgi:hypothetical protein
MDRRIVTLSSGGDAQASRSSDRYADMPASPSGSAKSASSTTGQPGPSSRIRNTHSASFTGFGRAAAHARAYSHSARRHRPDTAPVESSTVDIAAAMPSTAERASGRASATCPEVISSSTVSSTSRARRAYSLLARSSR